MKKIIFFNLLVILITSNSYAQQLKKYDHLYLHSDSLQHAKDSIKSERTNDTTDYSFINRRACYSIGTGYNGPLGVFGIKIEDRIFQINSQVQFGAGFGYATVLGFKSSAGVNIFFVSEQYKFMPFAGIDYVYAYGQDIYDRNDNISKPDYVVGHHSYADPCIGIKIKPWTDKKDEIGKELKLKDFWDLKIMAGYAYLFTPLNIQEHQTPTANWIYSYNTVKTIAQGGVFIAVNFGIDIPYLKKNRTKHPANKNTNKDIKRHF